MARRTRSRDGGSDRDSDRDRGKGKGKSRDRSRGRGGQNKSPNELTAAGEQRWRCRRTTTTARERQKERAREATRVESGGRQQAGSRSLGAFRCQCVEAYKHTYTHTCIELSAREIHTHTSTYHILHTQANICKWRNDS